MYQVSMLGRCRWHRHLSAIRIPCRNLMSYAFGTSRTSLRGETIGQLLDTVADSQPDREAFVFRFGSCDAGGPERRLMGQFRQDVNLLAGGLLAIGLEPGDRIGVWGPNSREWLTAQFAAAKAGLVLVTINPAYRAHELQFCVNRVGIRAMISATAFKSSDYCATLLELCPELTNSHKGQLSSRSMPSLTHLVTMGSSERPGVYQFEEVCQAGDNREAADQLARLGRRLQSDDVINIQFTSGTTGSPKGAALTHHNLLNNAFFAGVNAGFQQRRARICLPVPFYHCFGMSMGNLQMLLHDATLVYPAPSFYPIATLDAIEAERCTDMYGTPTMLIDLLTQVNLVARDLSSLNGGIIGGAPCPPDVMQRVATELCMRSVTIGYGSTETSPVVFQCRSDDSLERRSTSVGRVAQHVEVKIVDSVGRVVPTGQVGEICVRGYLVMRGYYNQPDMTAEVLGPDRWYRTGDLGYLDGDGYGHITGRIKDMVVRGGENLYPVEIENCLHSHPAVAEAQVVGVPDPRMGEELCASVRLLPGMRATEADLRAHCCGKIAHFKVPRYILFRDQMPMTVTGKVQKFRLREEVIELLGLEVSS